MVYFPSWHSDPRRNAFLGEDWTEWELVAEAVPRFEGHWQPVLPAYGYYDETDQTNMARNCSMAASAGVTAFLWDWYWYEGDFLNRPLDEAYLSLADPQVGFALMWANHDWKDVFPSRSIENAQWWPGAIDAAGFKTLTSVVIERYFTSPHYWRVDGAAWFSIYSLSHFVDGLGGIAQAASAIHSFREEAREAGVGELHVNALIGWETLSKDESELLGLDSVSRYNWLDCLPLDQGITFDYSKWRYIAEAQWDSDAATTPTKYVPNVTMGWDSTARVAPDVELVVSEWPHLPVVVGNTPQEFGGACAHALVWAQRNLSTPVIIVNAWNEWTEGCVIEPSVKWGTSYMKALNAAIDASEVTSDGTNNP